MCFSNFEHVLFAKMNGIDLFAMHSAIVLKGM